MEYIKTLYFSIKQRRQKFIAHTHTHIKFVFLTKAMQAPKLPIDTLPYTLTVHY